MKKLFILAIAAVAMTFASCGNKAANAGGEDSTAVDSTEAVAQQAQEAADGAISNLTEILKGKDANALKDAIESIKAKAGEFLAQNPDLAKEYLTKVQNFLKENGDKIPADQKPAIEAALGKLKSAHTAQDIAGIDAATNELNQVMQAASAQMYSQAGAQPGAGAGFQGEQQTGGQQSQGGNSDDTIQDADFEEVK